MKIVGYNYYGMIYLPENSSYKNIIVEYNNITYVGPQISFHPTGITRFIDFDITIEDNDLTVGNEVAECNKIEIGGNSTILHNSKPNSAFWFHNNGCYLKILSNAIANPIILCSRSSELIVYVIDFRVVSSDQKLYASIKHDLISPEGNILEAGLVYKDENGDIFTLSDTPTLVYTGKGNDGNTLKTSVTWSDDTGILLMIADKVICDTEYETSIVWTIEE